MYIVDKNVKRVYGMVLLLIPFIVLIFGFDVQFLDTGLVLMMFTIYSVGFLLAGISHKLAKKFDKKGIYWIITYLSIVLMIACVIIGFVLGGWNILVFILFASILLMIVLIQIAYYLFFN